MLPNRTSHAGVNRDLLYLIIQKPHRLVEKKVEDGEEGSHTHVCYSSYCNRKPIAPLISYGTMWSSDWFIWNPTKTYVACSTGCCNREEHLWNSEELASGGKVIIGVWRGGLCSVVLWNNNSRVEERCPFWTALYFWCPKCWNNLVIFGFTLILGKLDYQKFTVTKYFYLLSTSHSRNNAASL